jgi:hypothetical protein
MLSSLKLESFLFLIFLKLTRLLVDIRKDLPYSSLLLHLLLGLKFLSLFLLETHQLLRCFAIVVQPEFIFGFFDSLDGLLVTQLTLASAIFEICEGDVF